MNPVKTIRALSLAMVLALGTGCAGDRALFPETSYNQVGNDQIELTHPVTLFGNMELPVGTKVGFNDFPSRIHTIVPPKDITFDGVTLPATSELDFVSYGNRLIMSEVTLGADADFNDLSFKKKDKVSFNDDHSVAQAQIATKRSFDGKSYPPETVLWFKNGEVTRSETQADRERVAQERYREAQSCRAGCAPYTGEMYANCMNHCATL